MVVVVVLEEKIGLFLSILESLSLGLGLGRALLRKEGSFGFLQLQPMSTTTGWRLTTNLLLLDDISNLVWKMKGNMLVYVVWRYIYILLGWFKRGIG
jgi:hypothetical protein